MNKDTLRQIFVVLSVIGTIAVNALATLLPLNGQDTGAISDRFQVFFVPAGYVFSIWGVIYLGWIAFAIYQALPSRREDPLLRRIGWPFVFSGVANSAWLFAWHYNQFVLSLGIMLVLLLTLIYIYLAMGGARGAGSTAERWNVRVVFGLYLGWITVATIANATSVLDFVQWGGWGISPAVWAVIMLVVGAVVGWAMSWTQRDVAYLLVLVWAFVGIALKHSDTALVANAAWVTTAAVALAVVAAFFWGRAQKGQARQAFA